MIEPQDLNDRALRDRAVAAARGAAPFDLLVTGGTVADTATGRMRKRDVGIVGSLIASVHPAGSRSDSAATADARGAIVAPGLIDAHMHIESSMIVPGEYARAMLGRGVTTIVWDPHDLANIAGEAGMAYALAAAAAAPMRILVLAPSCVPSAPGYESAGAAFGSAQVQSLLAREDVAGVGEVMAMEPAIARAEPIAGIVQAGLDAGKLVCGHARGLQDAALNAYAAGGIASDHELTSGADLLAKLEAGLAVELRGSHPHLLPEFAAALGELGHVPHAVTLCTDDVFADDLLAAGGLDEVARSLVRCGLDPMEVLQAATRNAADRLGRADLGQVAPGRRADIAVFSDAAGFHAQLVIAGGRIVLPSAPAAEAAADAALPRALLESVRAGSFAADDFRIRASGKRVRVATIEKPRFTQWGECEADVIDGFASCPADKIAMAVVSRYGAAAKPQLAWLGGWGRWSGALATTFSHDCHNLTVFGCGPENMAAAANEAVRLGGGLAVAKAGKITASLALPAGGVMSDLPLAEVAAQLRAVRKAADSIAQWEPPNLSFKACFGASLACNPGPHLTDLGIVDCVAGRKLADPVLGPC